MCADLFLIVALALPCGGAIFLYSLIPAVADHGGKDAYTSEVLVFNIDVDGVVLVIGWHEIDLLVRGQAVSLAHSLVIIDTEATNLSGVDVPGLLEHQKISIMDSSTGHGVTVCILGKILF